MRTITAIMLVAAFASTIGLRTTVAQGQEKQIGVLWVDKSAMAERVSKGMLARLKEKAPDIKCEFKPAVKDEAAAMELFKQWQASKNGIVMLRSSGAEFLGKNPPSVPGFIGACSSPVALGIMKSMESPDGNVTGVTYHMDAKQRLEAFKKVFPNVKRIGLIVEDGHPSAPIDCEETKTACASLGIEYKEARCKTDADILKSGKQFAGETDLIVLGPQTLVALKAKELAGLAGTTPMAAYDPKPVTGIGAVCALVANDEKLGTMLADSIIAVVKEGKAVKDVPVKVDPDPEFLLNMTMVAKLGLKIPDDVLKKAKQMK